MTDPGIVCVMCAKHQRTIEADTGHLCRPCLLRIDSDLADLPDLIRNATTALRHGHGTGHTVPASRPPIDLAGIDPALVAVRLAQPPAEPVALLQVVEGWVRIVREERGLAAYGPWSAAAGRIGPGGCVDTLALLDASTALLRAHLDWCADQPWIDDLAAEVAACRAAVARWDPEREDAAPIVLCPSERPGSDHPCGGRIRLDHTTRCPRCGRVWDRHQLVRAASASTRAAEVWVDDAAASAATGVPQRTIRRWGARGLVRRSQGRYALGDVASTAARRAGR